MYLQEGLQQVIKSDVVVVVVIVAVVVVAVMVVVVLSVSSVLAGSTGADSK